MDSRGAASLLKDTIPIIDFSASGSFESYDLLRRGFTSVKSELLPSHPLELIEKNFQLNQDKTNFATLRNIQGLHAPLKLQMEFRAVKQVQRLPFLHSSNLALDTLRGNDGSISFEDILNGKYIVLNVMETFTVPKFYLQSSLPLWSKRIKHKIEKN
uniref:Proteasome maturation protein n=1 Tax=Amazona collaria TaxID=241587 RepID=A0A8B9EWC7_9PSIT